ncbi:MAG: DUF1934 domain-containing protein [Oribacterium sp.]
MKAEIRLRTLQRVDGKTEELVHSARGIVRREGGVLLVTYLLDGIHHEMRIDSARASVSVVRNWQEKGQLFYQEGRRHTVLYETPVGELELSFDTKRLLLFVPEEETERSVIELRYEVFQYGSSIMDCELRIEISPVK